MTNDMKQQVIDYFIKSNDYDVPEDIDNIWCETYEDWKDHMIDVMGLNVSKTNDWILKYIDFAQMMIDDDDVEVFIYDSYQNKVCEFYEWCRNGAWDGRAKEFIQTALDNTLFVVRCY